MTCVLKWWKYLWMSHWSCGDSMRLTGRSNQDLANRTSSPEPGHSFRGKWLLNENRVTLRKRRNRRRRTIRKERVEKIWREKKVLQVFPVLFIATNKLFFHSVDPFCFSSSKPRARVMSVWTDVKKLENKNKKNNNDDNDDDNNNNKQIQGQNKSQKEHNRKKMATICFISLNDGWLGVKHQLTYLLLEWRRCAFMLFVFL